jgi:hypothetical protein
MKRSEDSARLSARDPDPLSMVLAALGAVGSIASLVSLVQDKRREQEVDERLERQDHAEMVEHLAAAEASLAELASVLARIRITARAYRSQPLSARIDLSRSPNGLAFGEYGLLLDSKTIDVFLTLQDLAYRHSRDVQKALSMVFRVLYRTGAGIPEEQFQELVAVIRDVNSLLTRQESVQQLLTRVEAVVNRAGSAVHTIRTIF